MALDKLDWLERAGDWLNPILVKETRQSLKSRQFIVTFLLMLIAAWLISVFGTITTGDALEFGAAGRAFFLLYFDVLAIAIFAVVPYTAYRSLLNERDQTTLELLSITTLSPRQLVWGKLCSALVQVFIYYSAIAPFIAFTSLLQGFDLAQVTFVLTVSVLVSLLLTMLAVMMAAVPQNRHLQGGTTLLMFGGVVWIVMLILFGTPALLIEPIPFDDREFWIVIGCLVTAGLSYIFLFQQIATIHLTFESDNRSTGVRVACSIQFVLYWLGLEAISYWYSSSISTDEAVSWAAVACCHFAIVSFFLATEPDHVSRRVRRGFPKTRVMRLLSIPFQPGGQRGFVYLLTHLIVLDVLFVAFLIRHRSEWYEAHLWMLCMMFYVIAYIGLGTALGRWLRKLSAEVRPMHSRVIIVVLIAMGMIIPVLPGAFDIPGYADISNMLKVMNPVAMLSDASSYRGFSVGNRDFIVLLISVGVGVLFNLRPMRDGIAEVMRGPVPSKSVARPPVNVADVRVTISPSVELEQGPAQV